MNPVFGVHVGSSFQSRTGLLVAQPNAAGRDALASLFCIRVDNRAFLTACLWFAGHVSGQDVYLCYLLASPLSGKEWALTTPTDGCDVVPLGLALMHILILGISGRDTVAAAAVASSRFSRGPLKLKRPCVNTVKRIRRLKFWQPWLLSSMRLFRDNCSLILSCLRTYSVV